jgi:hypothetical protein
VKIKQILDESGLSFVWDFPNTVSTAWLDCTFTKAERHLHPKMG